MNKYKYFVCNELSEKLFVILILKCVEMFRIFFILFNVIITIDNIL